MNKTIKPQALKSGDTIGLATPAGIASQEDIVLVISKIENLGFKAYYPDSSIEPKGYPVSTDQQRADELNELFSNSDIAGIMCVRGGYGCTKILDLLDYDLIQRNPKPLIGYSDVTALLSAIYKFSGLVCFHGPVGKSTFTEYTTQCFKSVLMERKQRTVIRVSTQHKNQYIINGGNAKGILAGGNLSLLSSVTGTRYEPDFKDKIVFIEEIGEEPYRIDRMLTQLLQADNLSKAAAIILGQFNDCEQAEADKKISLTLMQVLTDRLQSLKIPIISGFSFGHIADNCTLPIGINAKLDADKYTITLTEAAVE